MGQSKKENRRENRKGWGGEGKREGNRVQKLKKRDIDGDKVRETVKEREGVKERNR